MGNTDRSKLIATTWITLALVASAIEPLVVKLGLKGHGSALQFLALKMLFGGIFMIPIYKHIKRIEKDNVLGIAYISTLYVLNYLFVYLALIHITAVVLITLITTTPAIVGLINQARGKDQLGRKFWLGFGFCFLGVMLTIDIFGQSGLATSPLGISLALLSVVASALYRTKMDGLTKALKPITISAYLFLVNLALGIALIPWLGTVTSGTLKISAWLGLAGAVANVAFLSALHLIGSTRLSILTVLQRPLVIVAAAVFLKEPLSTVQIVGVILVLAGVQAAKVQKPVPQRMVNNG